MADDQNQKISTIDDLVKELAKNSDQKQPSSDKSAGSQQPPVSSTMNKGLDTSRYPVNPSSDDTGPPPNLPGIRLDDKPSILATPIQPPRPTQLQPQPSPINVTKPPVFMSPKSIPNSPPPPIKSGVSLPSSVPLRPSPVQEYKSSIRTMDEDIVSIKSGQKPTGVDIPRKVTPEMPKAFIPGVTKPEGVTPTGPKPAIDLGRAERTGPLPTIAQPKKPFGQTQINPEPKKVQLGPTKPAEIQSPITVPESKKRIGRLFYFLIGGILVAGGLLYWFLVIRVPAPEVISPTPSKTVIPPVTKNLNEIFIGVPINFEVILSNNLSQDFKIFVETLDVDARKFLKINLVESINDTLAPISFINMFEKDPIFSPAVLKENITDSVVIVYGQSEAYNNDGSINFNVQNQKKTGFLAKVKNKSAVETIMRDWEFTIVNDLANYLFIDDISKEANTNFMDNTYRGVSIRYKNFPFPHITIDYAVLETPTGQTYLIIAGSRETMYAAIDTLLEQ